MQTPNEKTSVPEDAIVTQSSQVAADSIPRYTHDCDRCIFLGQYKDRDGDYDLYFCEQGCNTDTVIGRFGMVELYSTADDQGLFHQTLDRDDGPQYTSGMPFADMRIVPCLVEAKRIATQRGLIKSV